MRGQSAWVLIALAGCAGPSIGGSSSGPEGTTDPETADGSSDGTSAEDSDDADGSGDSTGEMLDIQWLCPADPERAPTFELGWDYKDGWLDLSPDGPVTITIGGQGSWMIPLGVRGDGFCVPADPFDYEHVPSLDITIEAEGLKAPIALVSDFPVSFEPIEPGGLGYTFIPMMLIDAVDVPDLEGRATTIRAELRARDVEPLAFALDGVLTISD